MARSGESLILSGYLITSILLKTRGANSYFTSFYARRVLRILPVFWLTLLALAFIFPHAHSFFLIAILFLANVSSWFGVTGLYYPLWSLCVEEHFYLIWPFVVRTFRRRILFCGIYRHLYRGPDSARLLRVEDGSPIFR